MKPQVCPDEDTLLGLLLGATSSEVEEHHVSVCEDCQRRMDLLRSEVRTLQGSTARSRPVSPGTSEEPANIGRYLVVGTLGTGGQARVYRGLHPRLGIEVAIKWSENPLAADTGGRDALTTEGQLLAQLSHPNLVRVLDLDTEQGRPFLVMEYIRGGDLEEHARKRKVRPAEAAAWVAQLARGLATAHAHHITHQDIKPRNVLIDESGQVRLSDFGLARLRREGGGEDQPLGGTLAYMAPEQARREVEKIGPASDLFGLGGILFFLLTGQAPFEGDNPLLVRQKAAAGEVSWAALEAARVPRALAAVCRKALAPRPEDRHASAEALAGELERTLRRPRWALAVLSAFLLLGVALAGFWIFRAGEVVVPSAEQPLITQIERQGIGSFRDIRTNLSLLEGDSYRIECQVPRVPHVALLLVDASGNATQRTDFSRTRQGSVDHLTFPSQGSLRATGPAGTELILVVASRAPLSPDKLTQQIGGPWPTLPSDVCLLLNREATSAKMTRGHEVIEGSGLAAARDRLESLRQELAPRCDFLAGILYQYERKGSR